MSVAEMPAIPVVIPPRPHQLDVVLERVGEALRTGTLKAGVRWSKQLHGELARVLALSDPSRLLLTVSGTAALRLAVACTAGKAEPGEEALLPSFTFPATAEVLVQLGYRLRFIDADPRSWNLCPVDLERALSERPARLVVAVDCFGTPVDYEALLSLCRAHGASLVADSAAGLGSTCRGRPLGTQADAHAFSMSFAKVLSAGGAGGAVVLPPGIVLDPKAGWTRSCELGELHAIAALDQLPHLSAMVERRRDISAAYERAIQDIDGLVVQAIHSLDRSARVHFVVRVVRARESLEAALESRGIQTRRYFNACHLTQWPSDRALPVSEALHSEVLALPLSSELRDDQVERVINGLRAGW